MHNILFLHISLIYLKSVSNKRMNIFYLTSTSFETAVPSSFNFKFGYNVAISPGGVQRRPENSKRFGISASSASTFKSNSDLK